MISAMSKGTSKITARKNEVGANSTSRNKPANIWSLKQQKNKNHPEISIIIPSAPERSFSAIVKNLRDIKPRDLDLQILIVKGTHPPTQRNLALKKAHGEIIFLFDDDIEIPAGVIEKVLQKFSLYPKISVIGGPNLTHKQNGFLQHCFGLAHGSLFTAGKTAPRYCPAKETLTANEDSLISCNLAFRATALQETPFDPRIFPNEENDLLARMSKKGYKMMYTPDFFVYHHRRRDLPSYLKQIFNWGTGRMKRTIALPSAFSAMFFIPLIFLAYLLSLFIFHPPWYLLPLALYFILDIIFAAETALKEKNPAYFFAMPFIFLLTHIAYGLGLAWGIPASIMAGALIKKPENGRKQEENMPIIEITMS